MDRKKIIEVVKALACSQGFYGRLLEFLTCGSTDAENAMSELESQKFKDAVDLVMYVES